MAPLAGLGEIPASLKTLAWKNFAQEISDDAPFRENVRKILPGLEKEGKAAVVKCIGQIVAGRGIIITGTPVDDLLAEALRAKAKEFAVGESLGALNRLTNPQLLTLASGGVAVADPKDAAEAAKTAGAVKIILVSNPSVCADLPRDGRVVSSKTGSQIRLVAGLSDPSLVSLESFQSRGSYVHHNNWKIYVTERPPTTKDHAGFDVSATFKMLKFEGDNVQFEASDRPGEFLKVDEDGNWILGTITSGERATFHLESKGGNK